MASPSFFGNNPYPWIVVLTPVIMFSAFLMLSSSFSFLLTSIALVLSILLFIFSRRKPCFEEKPVKEKEVSLSQRENLAPKEETETERSEVTTIQAKDFEREAEHQSHDSLVSSPDVLSEIECLDQLSTTEDSEMDWPFRDKADRSPDYSDDGSISDEDSLIEISLPSGHYVNHGKEIQQQPNKLSMQPKFPEYRTLPESIFQQRSLMQLLSELNNEVNEEDNLIEIDISMGSIKCSRFEIEA
ncbi:hypothetical protein SLEP1_g28688 [Rubroshorea leprosula]|uniref:Transmembrane protein n=1 Tax=Rubroshorea leprosula TaxID=152421 RepID=A0AAV5K0J8_9ROSI|nr:hypothetical protein SLEP1_g28688 [Rubroshorea leprosula]